MKANELRERMIALADERYRSFSASLIPNVGPMLGVRLPELRKMARQIAAGARGTEGDWRVWYAQADDLYFEDRMLLGMVIGYAPFDDVEERLRYMADFVPRIDNWSICDSFCTGLKFTRTCRERVWSFLQPYLSSDKEYELRFAIVMLLNYYVEESDLEAVLERLDRIRHEGYYVKMAVAWAIATCYVKFPERTMIYLHDNMLDKFTYNKALQKIVESRHVDRMAKERIKGMRLR